jgi:hypothetical protein
VNRHLGTLLKLLAKPSVGSSQRASSADQDVGTRQRSGKGKDEGHEGTQRRAPSSSQAKRASTARWGSSWQLAKVNYAAPCHVSVCATFSTGDPHLEPIKTGGARIGEADAASMRPIQEIDARGMQRKATSLCTRRDIAAL